MTPFDMESEQNYCNKEMAERYLKSEAYVEGLLCRSLQRATRPVTHEEILKVLSIRASADEDMVLRILLHLEAMGHVEKHTTWRWVQ